MTPVDLWVEWSRPLGAEDVVALAWLVDELRRRRMAEAPEKVAIAEQISIVEHWAADRRRLAEDMADAEDYADARAAWLDQARRLDAAVKTLRWVDANAEMLRRVARMLAVFPEAEAIGVGESDHA